VAGWGVTCGAPAVVAAQPHVGVVQVHPSEAAGLLGAAAEGGTGSGDGGGGGAGRRARALVDSRASCPTGNPTQHYQSVRSGDV
jgi:hypothetical protein